MKRRIFTLLLAALMLLSACGGTDTGNTGDQQSEGQQASSQDGEKVLTIGTYMAVTTLVPDSYGYRTNSWTENKKYLPIPQSEIDAAQGTLIQNNY